MTSLPADRVKLTDRGTIEEGKKADILIFDYEKFRDVATYKNPAVFSKGMETVIINGEICFLDGKLIKNDSGCLLDGS